MIAVERRAATALYRILRTQRERRPWIVPVNACPVVAHCFQSAGVPMQLVDIEEKTLLLSEEQTIDLLAQKSFGGVLYIRTYGFLDDRSGFFRRLRAADLQIVIVDDRAVCEPDVSGLLPSDVDAVLFSTGSRKPVDMGWGGVCVMRSGMKYAAVTNAFEAEALERVTAETASAMREREPFTVPSVEWLDARNVSDYEAAEWWRRLPAAAEAVRAVRDARNAIYRGRIPPECQLGPGYDTWRFQIRVREPESLVRKLFAAGLFASRHYASLGGSLEPGCRFPVAELLASRIVNLFNDHHVTEAMAEQTAEIVVRHVAGGLVRN